MSKVLTPEFRASFAAVFKAKPVKGDTSGKEKYSITMIFPKDADLSTLKKAAEEAAFAKFGKEAVEKLMKAGKFKTPFKDQKEAVSSDGEQYAGFTEGVYIQASSDTKPGLVDAKVQDIIDETEFYSGCWARATVQAYAWDHPTGGKGVSFGLMNVQKLRDGDRLGGGRSKPQDDFEPVKGANDDGASGSAEALFG